MTVSAEESGEALSRRRPGRDDLSLDAAEANCSCLPGRRLGKTTVLRVDRRPGTPTRGSVAIGGRRRRPARGSATWPWSSAGRPLPAPLGLRQHGLRAAAARLGRAETTAAFASGRRPGDRRTAVAPAGRDFPGGSNSAWRWAAPSSAGPRCSFRRAAGEPRRRPAQGPLRQEIRRGACPAGNTMIYVTHDQSEP